MRRGTARCVWQPGRRGDAPGGACSLLFRLAHRRGADVTVHDADVSFVVERERATRAQASLSPWMDASGPPSRLCRHRSFRYNVSHAW